uniref:Uncharacterized protein n=1 Tax=viral metagenome TaxID=1070528 RepID=A0A6C0BY81_9ZZZZ
MIIFANLIDLFQIWLDNINNELNSVTLLLNNTN